MAVEYLNIFNAATLLLTLSYASYQDLKTRLVDDWVWLACASITAPVTVFTVLLGHVDLFLAAVSIIMTAVLSVLFYVVGLYGGADAKGLIVIGLAYPLSMFGYRYHPFTPLTVLLNGLLISLIIPASMAIINAYRIFVRREDLFREFRHEKAHRKLLALFLGTIITNPESRKYWAPMEEFRGDWRFRFSVGIEEYWRPLRPGGWATPSIPLLVSILGGLLLNYGIGDLSAVIIKLLTP
ncbi:MAG: A24 family peptidase [Nitrososphaerota archaeon]|nr:prepilin peptidase [Candidatus Calditenuaceae archaeon]MDW8072714.1 A24 family peptidase [Nitrososphaerota archaeon]